MHDQFMEMLKERDEDGSCIVGGLNYAGEAYDRLQAQSDEIERLREALDELLPHALYLLTQMEDGLNKKPQPLRDKIRRARAALEEKK